MNKEALKLAIQLRDAVSGYWTENEIPIIEKLIELLAHPAQEPVAWLCSPDENGLFDLPTPDKACEDCFLVYTTPPHPTQKPYGYVSDDKNMEFQKDKPEIGRWVEVYTTPPRRPWVGLTDEEIKAVNAQVSQIPPIDYTTTTYAKAIEAKLKEKNT